MPEREASEGGKGSRNFQLTKHRKRKDKLFHSLKQQTFLLHDSSSPVTSSSTDNLIFGSVLTWHSYLRNETKSLACDRARDDILLSYTPESFCVADSILRFHSFRSGWCRTENRWSPENTKFSEAKMWISFLRNHDTYRPRTNKERRREKNMKKWY